MRVLYDHPPRTVAFYTNYVLLLIIIISPILIIVPWWTASLAPLWIAGLLIGILVLRLSSLVKQMLVVYTVLEDTGLPKDLDISHLELPVPDTLADAVVQLEMEGFERLGEIESYVAGLDHATPIWIYRSAKGNIIAAMLEIGKPVAPYLGFTTITEKGIVETTYPNGHQIKLPQALFSGVRSQVLAAYRHHIQQVRAFTAGGERILIIKSIAQYLHYDKHFAPQYKVRMWHSVFDRVVGETFLTLGLVPGFLLVPTWFVPELYGDIFSGNRLMVGFGMLVLGLTAASIVGLRSRGIAGPKQSKTKS